MNHIAWDYETTYYHIYPMTNEGEVLINDYAITLELPETKENTDNVSKIVILLNKLIK